jgi:hypothetical protein
MEFEMEDSTKGLPLLPYAGTSGWSGSSTSHARALEADRSGETSRRQAEVIRFLADRGTTGATWRSVGEALGLHHGSSSGVLSVLHKEGRICRLSETRGRCKVYCLPEYVDDRATEEHRSRAARSCPNCGHVL